MTNEKGTIKGLKEENARLLETINQQELKIEYLRAVREEHNTFRGSFGNGFVTYNQAMQVIQTQQNAVVESERQRINYERQAQREAALQSQYTPSLYQSTSLACALL